MLSSLCVALMRTLVLLKVIDRWRDALDISNKYLLGNDYLIPELSVTAYIVLEVVTVTLVIIMQGLRLPAVTSLRLCRLPCSS